MFASHSKLPFSPHSRNPTKRSNLKRKVQASTLVWAIPTLYYCFQYALIQRGGAAKIISPIFFADLKHINVHLDISTQLLILFTLLCLICWNIRQCSCRAEWYFQFQFIKIILSCDTNFAWNKSIQELIKYMLTGWLQFCKWEGWKNCAWKSCICLFV